MVVDAMVPGGSGAGADRAGCVRPFPVLPSVTSHRKPECTTAQVFTQGAWATTASWDPDSHPQEVRHADGRNESRKMYWSDGKALL